jgi:hypothetical protein
MFKIRTVVLFGVAFILVTALATTAYFKMIPPAPSPSIPAANFVSESATLAPVSAKPSTAHSVYMSEQTLKRILNEAYENHWGTRDQALLHILNGRYEHRCCGLPR